MRYGDPMRFMMMAFAAAAGLLSGLIASAAGIAPGTADHGHKLYLESGCAACHAASIDEEEGGGGPLRAGHPLEGAAYRGTWWNGRITTDAAEASDFCRQTFLDPNGEEGFSTQERKALVLFMQGLGSDRGISPLTLLRRDAGDVDLRVGDRGRGEALYRRACQACHGATDPGKVDAEVRKMSETLSPAQLADVIRKGRGTMPFFQVDRLTAPQVADIAAWVESVTKTGAGQGR